MSLRWFVISMAVAGFALAAAMVVFLLMAQGH